MRSTPSAARSTTSPTTAARAESARPSSTRWRADIDALYAGAPAPRVRDLGVPMQRYDLQARGFPRRDRRHGDGCVRGHRRARRGDARPLLRPGRERGRPAVGADLRHAGRAGRQARQHLGRALQLTNILRDIDEDAGIGRLYLPREKLAAIGHDRSDAARGVAHPRIGEVCAAVAGARPRRITRPTWAIIAEEPAQGHQGGAA